MRFEEIIISTVAIYLFTPECHAGANDGFVFSEKHQAYYKGFHTNLKFDDAVDICNLINAKLYLPKSKTEQSDVITALNITNQFMWYAITDRIKEGTFVPIDGSRKNNYFIEWKKGEPNDAEKNEDCVAFNGSEVYDCPCTFLFRFVCVKYPPQRYQSMLENYQYVPDLKKSYKLYLEPKDWDDALIRCTNDGAHLSVVENDNEAAYLKELLKSMTNVGNEIVDHSFLGFHDKKQKGKFVTVTGRRLNTNMKWKNHKMIGEANENCGALNRNGELIVTSCYTPKMFICEIPDVDYFISPKNDINDYVDHPGLHILYKINHSLQTWNDARKSCRMENATLAMPKNKAEADEILNIFHKTLNENVKNIHIGFHDLFTKGEYLTENGDSIQFYYHEFNRNQFNKSKTHGNCGSINREGKLDHISCSKASPFMCQIRTLPYRTNNMPKSYISDNDYVYGYDFDHGYKLHLNPRTWGTARLICASEGGNLAVINSVKEKDYLLELFNKSKHEIIYPVEHSNNILLGFHDLFEEGHHTSITGESLENSGYFIWKTGDKRNLEENCGSMTSDGFLDDISCFVPAVFFCEISNWNER